MKKPSQIFDTPQATGFDRVTHNTREGIEEMIEQKSLSARDCLPDEEVINASQAVEIFHQELQKARHDWLREEIVKLEGMKKKGQNGEGLPFENSPEIYGNARMEAWKNGCNKAFQTIIDRYHSELNQPINSIFKE